MISNESTGVCDAFPDIVFERNSRASHVSDAGKSLKAMPATNLGLFASAILHIAEMGAGMDSISLGDLAGDGAPSANVAEAARSLMRPASLSVVPDECDFADGSNVTMSCRDLATVLLAVDRESHDPGMNSFNACRHFGANAHVVGQLCNVSDVLAFMSESALPKVRVPLVPLVLATFESVSGASGDLSFIRSKFGRTNFSFDENGRLILSSTERAQISISNDNVVDRLAGFYACFDQRFEAIFYPTSKRELAMLSCATQTSMASAIWQSAMLDGLPERQDDVWLMGALAGGDDTSLYAGMTATATAPYIQHPSRALVGHYDQGAMAREVLRHMGVSPKAEGMPLGAASVSSLVPFEAVGYDEENGEVNEHLHALHLLLSSGDASPYPRMRVPSELDPDRSVASFVLSFLGHGVPIPSPADMLVSFMRSFDVALSVDDGSVSRTRQLEQATAVIDIMVGRITERGTEWSPLIDNTTVVTKDVQLQYVLGMFVSDGLPKGAEVPMSFRQLNALALGYKTEAIKQALDSDFSLSLGGSAGVADTIMAIIGGLDDRSLEREAAIYGETDVDPIRFTISAMAMPERLASSDMRRMQLSPQHLMSMLIEMPSAFSDAYGKVVGNRMLATYTRSNGHNVASSIKVYQPFFMLHDDVRFGSRVIGATVHDDAPQALMDKVLPDDDEALLEDEGVPTDKGGIRDFVAGAPDRLVEATVIQAFMSVVCGIDIDGSGNHGSTSCHDNKAMLVEAIRNKPESVASIRSGGRYELHPSVIRIADVLFRHMSEWRRDDLGGLRCLYSRCMALSLMLHTIIDRGVFPRSIPIAYGTMFEATYPRSWEGAEDWFGREGERAASLGDGTGRQPARHDPGDHGRKSAPGQILSRSSDLGKLLSCSVDMTASAEANGGNNIVERDEELQEVISVLMRREKSNVMILGEAGTGKTALVELLAASILNGNVPDRLKSKHLLQMDVMTLSSYSEGSVAEIFDDARGKDVILFIDEIHALQPRTMNALKPYLARADISLIGATTNSEYQATILKDKALARRFSTIRLHELNQEQTVICIKSRMKEYEQWYGVAYDTKAPYAIATAASTYMTNRHSPDRELDVMDVAGAIASMASRTVVLEDDAYAAVRQLTGNKSVLSMNDVQRSISSQSGGISSRVEKAFGDIVSQDDAKRVVSEGLALSQIGLRSGGSPKNVLMFVGPSGVGKTMMAERIPAFLGTSHDAVLSINLSEYIGKHEYSRLVGSPPGYIGFEQGGLLTNFGMAHPDGVVIFDEIEKASDTTRQMLLKLFDRGYIESAAGEKVDCRSMTFVCTSNAGFGGAGTKRAGFLDTTGEKTYDERVRGVKETLIKALGAPFVGRFDDIVVFNELGIDDILQSCRNEYEALVENYKKSKGIDVKEFFTQGDLDKILESISEREISEIGARSIMKRIDREVERAIAGIKD